MPDTRKALVTRAGNGEGFSDDDRNDLRSCLDQLRKMNETVSTLKTNLKNAATVINAQAKTISCLNSQINVLNYRLDAQQQYGRRESWGLEFGKNGVPEELGNDVEAIVMDVVKEINENATDKDTGRKIDPIIFKPKHIQRCHFMGNKRIICKMIPFKVRMQILLNKRVVNGAKTGKYKNVFICEDLTPLRRRLIWYVKNHCKTKFTKVHTRNGVIRAKKVGKDGDGDPWLSFSNPDELFKHLDEGDEFNLEIFNKDLHGFKILPDLPCTEYVADFS